MNKLPYLLLFLILQSCAPNILVRRIHNLDNHGDRCVMHSLNVDGVDQYIQFGNCADMDSLDREIVRIILNNFEKRKRVLDKYDLETGELRDTSKYNQ